MSILTAPEVDVRASDIFSELDYRLQTGPMASYLAYLKAHSPSRYQAKLDHPAEAERYQKMRWAEAGDYEALAEHEATRSLQAVEEALVCASPDESLMVRRYFALNYDRKDKNAEASLLTAWAQERNFRRGIGVLATLHSGSVISLPEYDYGMDPEAYHDTRILFTSPEIGRVIIQNTLQRFKAPETPDEARHIPDELVGMPYGSLYTFSRDPIAGA